MNYLIFSPQKYRKQSFVRYGLQRKIEIMVLNEKLGIAKGKIYYSFKDLFYLSKWICRQVDKSEEQFFKVCDGLNHFPGKAP